MKSCSKVAGRTRPTLHKNDLARLFPGFSRNLQEQLCWKTSMKGYFSKRFLQVSFSLVLQGSSTLTKLEQNNGEAFFEKLYHWYFSVAFFQFFQSTCGQLLLGIEYIKYVKFTWLSLPCFEVFKPLGVTSSLLVTDFFFIFQFNF